MFKLVVLSALIAMVASKPSGYIAPLAYSAPLAVVHHAPILHAPLLHAPVVHAPTLLTYGPAAVSSQSSTVVHNKGALVAAWPAPIAHHGLVAAPLAVSSW